jgi:hypothetical protein
MTTLGEVSGLPLATSHGLAGCGPVARSRTAMPWSFG